jgi:hypothetical protein
MRHAPAALQWPRARCSDPSTPLSNSPCAIHGANQPALSPTFTSCLIAATRQSGLAGAGLRAAVMLSARLPRRLFREDLHREGLKFSPQRLGTRPNAKPAEVPILGPPGEWEWRVGRDC